jgi:hypothetical protein
MLGGEPGTISGFSALGLAFLY